MMQKYFKIFCSAQAVVECLTLNGEFLSKNDLRKQQNELRKQQHYTLLLEQFIDEINELRDAPANPASAVVALGPDCESKGRRPRCDVPYGDPSAQDKLSPEKWEKYRAEMIRMGQPDPAEEIKLSPEESKKIQAELERIGW